MRLKDILISEGKRESIREPETLNKLFQNGRLYNRKRKLYRSIHGGTIYRAEMREMEKRDPLDTPLKVFHLLNGLSMRSENQKYPSREKSRFAASYMDEEHLSQFGDKVYYVFPSSDAKIASLEEDAVHIIRSIEYEMPNNFRGLERYFGINDTKDPLGNQRLEDEAYKKRINNFPHLYSFVKSYDEFNWKEFKVVVRDHKNDIIREAKKMKELDSTSRLISEEVEQVVSTFDVAEDYFDSLVEGVMGLSEEIIFGGDEYLLANRRWFDKNFKWNGNSWEMKNET